ncbi:MAG: sigma-70 family RNA polymerase sigma factor [Planctomycetota bacterium]
MRQYRETRDPQDIAAIFDCCADELFATAMHMLGDAGDAEDALQETFVSLIKSAGRYDPSRPAMPYLVGVLQRQTLYRARKNRRRPDQGRLEVPATASPADSAERAELGLALREAINGLPETYRVVLGTVLDESAAPAEIANRMGESPGAIRTRIHRGLGMLRKRLPVGYALPGALLMLEGRSLAAVRDAVVARASSEAAVGAAGTAAAKVVALLSTTGAKVAGALAIAVLAGVAVTRIQGEGGMASPTESVTAMSAVQDGAGAVSEDEAAQEPSPLPLAGAQGTEGAGDEGPGEASLTRAMVEPPPVQRGEFAFHYKQGYSFGEDALVPANRADVIFETCAGGISSITLEAPCGGARLPVSEQKIGETPCSPDCYLRSVVSVDPDQVKLKQRIRTDDRDLLSNAFVIKTRRGGWAACFLTERGDEGGWQEHLATVRYVYNPAGPCLVDEKRPVEEIDGVRFDMSAFLTDPASDALLAEKEALLAEYARRLEALHAELGALDELAARYAANLGVQESTDEGVAAVLSRQRGSEIMGNLGEELGLRECPDYIAATYSFEHATRDDEEKTRNDWDLQVSGSGRARLAIRVNTVTDDRSRIWCMGLQPFEGLGTEVFPEPILPGEEYDRRFSPEVLEGHSYLIRTLDSESHLWAALKVLCITDGDGVVFRWRKLATSKRLEALVRSPEAYLTSPIVRVQMRTGAGGGNPNRVFLDGTKNAYLDAISPVPVDLTRPLYSKDESVAWIETGLIPDGSVWVVTAIDYVAQTPGDSNGHGEFVVGFKNEKLVEIPESETPTRGRWTGRVELRPGDESRFYVELANSSLCDVTVQGHFETDQTPR